MTAPLTVMVVEDHDDLREATVHFLQQNGYHAIGVPCAEDVDDTPMNAVPDLYVLDLGLPGEDGLSLAKRLRAAHPLAGIVITTARTQLSDRLIGYAVGADIYLPKPVDPQELLATLAALSKRVRPQVVAADALTLNDQQGMLSGPGGESRLSEGEKRLLVALAIAKDQALERWQVALHLSPDNEDMTADNLQNRISVVRKKLLACGVDGQMLKAVRGSGYRLCIPLVVT